MKLLSGRSKKMDDRGCPILIQGRPLWVCMETDMICWSLAKRLAYGVLQGCVYLGEGRMVRELSGDLLGGSFEEGGSGSSRAGCAWFWDKSQSHPASRPLAAILKKGLSLGGRDRCEHTLCCEHRGAKQLIKSALLLGWLSFSLVGLRTNRKIFSASAHDQRSMKKSFCFVIAIRLVLVFSRSC